MSKIKVVYWSGTGNTEKMAELIVEGIVAAGKEGEALEISSVSPSDVKDDSVIVIGSPAMGDEEIEESEVEPFFAELEGELSGKNLAIFGSYEWADGEWMTKWEERAREAGAVLVTGKGLIAYDLPDEDASMACIEFGKAIAAI